MKVYESRPVKHAVIVRPEKDVQDYEVWILEPKLVGTMERLGTQRVVVDGSPHLHFTNLSTAVGFICEKEGVEGLDTPLKGPYVKSVRVTRETPEIDRRIDALIGPETFLETVKLTGTRLREIDQDAFSAAVMRMPGSGERPSLEVVMEALDHTFEFNQETLKRYGMNEAKLYKLFSSEPSRSKLSEIILELTRRLVSDYNEALDNNNMLKFKIHHDNVPKTVEIIRELLKEMWRTPGSQHATLVHNLRKSSPSNMTRELDQILTKSMQEVFSNKQQRR
jgi:hypothetical protein